MGPLRVALSVLFVLLIVAGLSIQVLAEARGGSDSLRSRRRGWLSRPRTWYAAAGIVFLAVVTITILFPE